MIIRTIQRYRFIPTHVGNTQGIHQADRKVTVHPHTRGEHSRRKTSMVMMFGSSPHTWGTHELKCSMMPARRFIPTHVGNTDGRMNSNQPRSVHPHTRGEHGSTVHYALSARGSSPHTWGTRHLHGLLVSKVGFIPTHVGNTNRVGMISVKSSVHPHTRGEHITIDGQADAYYGSSPHTWGTLRGGEAVPEIVRFIPTHVGNTLDLRVTDFLMPVHPHTRGEHPHSP